MLFPALLKSYLDGVVNDSDPLAMNDIYVLSLRYHYPQK